MPSKKNRNPVDTHNHHLSHIIPSPPTAAVPLTSPTRRRRPIGLPCRTPSHSPSMPTAIVLLLFHVRRRHPTLLPHSTPSRSCPSPPSPVASSLLLPSTATHHTAALPRPPLTVWRCWNPLTGGRRESSLPSDTWLPTARLCRNPMWKTEVNCNCQNPQLEYYTKQHYDSVHMKMPKSLLFSKLDDARWQEQQEEEELQREIDLLLIPEEKTILDQNNILDATKISSPKWHPLHSYALALQIPLMDRLLNSDVDINYMCEVVLTIRMKGMHFLRSYN
ncbi:hypothetical protein GUJ93_ZPchr0011g27964 [Zizania palustris]|uniref:Uncharacterized protein n=1 Tax=Zizania palustris TaxID=103762 RepID=A0A8J6BS27_ZIZPA|nr:hypothetical protein GUJ93_ZPchr0011g27964 [Zizania palustris]